MMSDEKKKKKKKKKPKLPQVSYVIWLFMAVLFLEIPIIGGVGKEFLSGLE